MEDLRLSEEEVKDGAPFAALCYVLCLWIMTFLFKKDNRFAYYHARQGIVIFVGEMTFACLSLLPLIGIIFYVTGLLMFLGVSLCGVYYALTGRVDSIPVVSDIAEKLVV